MAVCGNIIGSCSRSICKRSSILEDSVAAFDARIAAALSPFRDIAERLNDVPGLGTTAIETVIAEIGTDMSLFPTAGHLLSWTGLTPRLDESAGKRRSTRIKKGAPWLKPVLVQSAWGAVRKTIAIFRLSSCASKRAAEPRRRPSWLPHRSSRPSTTCCATALATRSRLRILRRRDPAKAAAWLGEPYSKPRLSGRNQGRGMKEPVLGR